MILLRLSSLNSILIIVLSLSWNLPASASDVLILKNIEVNSNDESKDVRLEFDSEFSGEPLINFESGSISFRFDSVQISPTLPSFIATKSHTIIKAVRAIQVPGRDVVHLDILLNSSRYKTEFPVITRSGNYISLGLNGELASLPPLSSTDTLTREAEERVKNDQKISTNILENSTDDSSLKNTVDFLPIENEDWTVTMLTLVLSLLFVLLLIYLIAYIYNRFFSGRFPSIQGAIRIKQVSSFHVGPKQKVIILDMNNRKFACGVTASSINLIAELEDETDQSFLHAITADEKNDEIKVDQARAKFFKTSRSDHQKSHSETINKLKMDENHEISLKDIENSNDLFLKQNSEKKDKKNKSEDKNKMHSTRVRRPLENKSEKFENLTHGSLAVQDFAKKLSEKLKFLKPIK